MNRETSPCRDSQLVGLFDDYERGRKASRARAELINSKNRNILGNSHFAMFENNWREVLDVIRGWIGQRVPAGVTQTA